MNFQAVTFIVKVESERIVLLVHDSQSVFIEFIVQRISEAVKEKLLSGLGHELRDVNDDLFHRSGGEESVYRRNEMVEVGFFHKEDV